MGPAWGFTTKYGGLIGEVVLICLIVGGGFVVVNPKKSPPRIESTDAVVESPAAQPEATVAPLAVPISGTAAATQRQPVPANTAMGVYSGPGATAAHDSFAQWLGQPVPYATDYVDYKGGWQKDFVDSKTWLAEPWGRWVSGGPGRRLVLGVPMLEQGNEGQFTQGVSGSFDPYFSQLASELVGNNLGNSIIRLGYEANCSTIGPWQATDNPGGYKALYRHEEAVMQTAPGANFAFDWTVCNGLQTGQTLDSFEAFYPGDDVVSIMGMDIYDVKWMDPSVTPSQRWDYAWNRRLGIGEFLQFAGSHAKSVSYPEWGLYKPGDSFGGGGDDPFFIQKMSELIKTTSPVYQSYFNVDWGGGVLFDFSQGKAAFKQLFGS